MDPFFFIQPFRVVNVCGRQYQVVSDQEIYILMLWWLNVMTILPASAEKTSTKHKDKYRTEHCHIRS